MPTSFLSGLSDDCKAFIDGTAYDKRYMLVNSRNRNRKIYRSGSTVAAQNAGIDAPTVAPTASAGAGGNLYYCYVYVNKFFVDPLALEALDPFIRSNASPALTVASIGGAATNIAPTLSTDSQVTHIWLYVSSDNATFYRLTSSYEVANSGTPTWTGVTTVPTAGYVLEIDNYPLDTCRIVCESNEFYLYAGFVPLTGNASATTGSPTITISSGTFPDGVIGLFFQFDGETTGGPSGNGVFIATYATTQTLTLVDASGAAYNYDGAGNKTNQPFRVWRSASVVQISKRYNPDFTPGVIDTDFLILCQASVTGIAKPTTGYTPRVHCNTNGKKSVFIADLTQGIPARIYQTNSAYAMCCPRAYTAAGGRLFYYDKDAGVIEDRGVQHVPLTLPVIPNLIRSLSLASSDIAEMEYDDSRNLLFLSVAPSGYSKGYYLIVYNLTTNTWNLWFMVPDVLSMRKVKQSDGTTVVKFGSSEGSITVWPSAGFNEAVGQSIYGVCSANDDATHLTTAGTPFPTAGNKLKDRWVMVWDDSLTDPTYQFARISDNTSSRLTLDTFIGPNSTSGFSPVPTIGNAFWCGPIQSILGPCYDFNATPDEDGQLMDVAITTSGLEETSDTRIALYRNFETSPTVGTQMTHNLYASSDTDPDHQSIKLGAQVSVETTGVTGWQITDNSETPMSLKSVVKRVKFVSEQMNKPMRRKS